MVSIDTVIYACGMLLSAVSAIFALYVRSTAKDQANAACALQKTGFDKSIDEIDRRIDEQGVRITQNHDRITRLEGALDTLPKMPDFNRLVSQIADMAGDVKAMKAEMEGLKDSSRANGAKLERLEGHVFKIES